MELHQRGQVGKTHVVRTRRHTGHRATRAITCVDGHVEFGVLKVALGRRVREQRSGAFKTPVELELDGGGLGVGDTKSCTRSQHYGGPDKRLKKGAFLHENSCEMRG